MSHENDPVTVLPGVGTKRAELFARLGIQTVGELLRFYPRGYDDAADPSHPQAGAANVGADKADRRRPHRAAESDVF